MRKLHLIKLTNHRLDVIQRTVIELIFVTMLSTFLLLLSSSTLVGDDLRAGFSGIVFWKVFAIFLTWTSSKQYLSFSFRSFSSSAILGLVLFINEGVDFVFLSCFSVKGVVSSLEKLRNCLG